MLLLLLLLLLLSDFDGDVEDSGDPQTRQHLDVCGVMFSSQVEVRENTDRLGGVRRGSPTLSAKVGKVGRDRSVSRGRVGRKW